METQEKKEIKVARTDLKKIFKSIIKVISLMQVLQIVLAVLLLLLLFFVKEGLGWGQYDYYYDYGAGKIYFNGYRVIVEYVSLAVFGVMMYSYFRQRRQELAIISGALALLFRPFWDTKLSMETWNLIHVVVAALLIVLAVCDFVNNMKKTR